MTFGPKETEDTILFSQLKKQYDIAKTRANLTEQIQNQSEQMSAEKRKQIFMEVHNVNKATGVIAEERANLRDNEVKLNQEMLNEWEKQTTENLQREVINID